VNRELSTSNMGSRAPTKGYMVQNGQGLADTYFDASLKMISARLGFNHFVSWNFDLVTKEHLGKIDGLGDLALAIPMLLTGFEVSWSTLTLEITSVYNSMYPT